MGKYVGKHRRNAPNRPGGAKNTTPGKTMNTNVDPQVKALAG